MFCPNCGKKLSDTDAFCDSCGSAVSSANISNANIPDVNHSPSMPPSAPQKDSDKTFSVLAGIIAVLMIVLIGLLAFSFTSGKKKPIVSDTSTPVNPVISTPINTPSDIPETPEPEEKVNPIDTLPDKINMFLEENGLANDIAVAVIDNSTGIPYLSSGANLSYESWGFYLPVYMALCDRYPQSYASYKNDIMSGDAGKCNTAANFAIDLFNGPQYISNYIGSMGYPSTVYGRKFGDVNATNGNYTTAYEAASILYQFYMQDNPSKLCYKPANFGISVPYGATMYAQFGTENSAVKKNLNIFAIVSGEQSDYCIAVMTKNYASSDGMLNELLNYIHSIMEGSY